MEFTAPLVSETLKAEVVEAVERNKRSKVLKQSMSTLGKGSGKGSKRQTRRQWSSSPHPPPAKKAKEQTFKHPAAKKQDNKSWKGKKSPAKGSWNKDFKKGGRDNQGS